VVATINDRLGDWASGDQEPRCTGATPNTPGAFRRVAFRCVSEYKGRVVLRGAAGVPSSGTSMSRDPGSVAPGRVIAAQEREIATSAVVMREGTCRPGGHSSSETSPRDVPGVSEPDLASQR
jgi:hypothetical protein